MLRKSVEVRNKLPISRMEIEPRDLGVISTILQTTELIVLNLSGLLEPDAGRLAFQGWSAIRTEIRRSFFNQTVVNLWNSPPQTAVNAESWRLFKDEIDRFLDCRVNNGS